MVKSVPASYLKKAIVLALSLFFIACSEQPAEHFKLDGATMGTRYNITVVAREGVEENPGQLQKVIDEQLRVINAQMSTWQDDSELSRLNRVPARQWTEVSPNLFDVLMLSLELGWLSNGAFDITVSPVLKLWGFGAGAQRPNILPEKVDIEKQLALIGFNQIAFDLLNNSIQKRGEITIDLSAIAKGFAVDKIAELLLYAGYQHFMVEVGGELRLQGNNPTGVPWKIAIEVPETNSLGQVHRAVAISDAAMATSGDYRNYFEKDGKRYSHTIDPKSGYPITHRLASVTVIADSAAYADGLATALNVMGPEMGMTLAKEQNFAVYMLLKTDEGFEPVYTEAFSAYLN